MRKPRSSLSQRVKTAYDRAGVSGRLLLAVSGGADSVAMLRVTLEMATVTNLVPIVAHVDHGLRDDSAEEARWVAELAARLGVECVTARLDVRRRADETRCGIEEVARRLRYAFLLETALRVGAPTIATAHTADDQAETVLHHLLRGTGLRGLRGIASRRRLMPAVTLVRPMLEVRRTEIEDLLAAIDQPFLTDPSNADMKFTRNRLRHDVLPLLRKGVNPQVDEALLRLARQASEASSLIRRLARRELREALVETSSEVIRLKTRRLRLRPRPVVREAIVLAWRKAQWPRQSMGFAHWEALASVAIDGGRRTLPGETDARRRRGELILRRLPT